MDAPATDASPPVGSSRTEDVPIQYPPPKRPSNASKRLFWTLNGPLETAIQVAPNTTYEPGDLFEPYCRPATEPDGAPSWHPVSLESLTTPPTSSTTVEVYCLNSWVDYFDDIHYPCRDFREHDDADDSGSEDDSRYGEHPLGEPGQRVRLRCYCGQEWPFSPKLEVKSSGDFLTIHEYVSAVHPWVMGMRDKILEALSVVDGGHKPWPPETTLAVTGSFGDGYLWLDDAKKWVLEHKGPSIAQLGTSKVTPGMTMSERLANGMRANEAAAAMVDEILKQAGAEYTGPPIRVPPKT